MSTTDDTTSTEIVELKERIFQLIDGYKSQAEFGRATDIDRSLVSALKTGRIKNLSFQLLHKIVEGTGCDAEWLITGDGVPFPSDGIGTLKSASHKGRDAHRSKRVESELFKDLLPGQERPEKDREFLLLLRQMIDNYLS